MLQKIYEFFSKVGDMRILMTPVLFVLALFAGSWQYLRQTLPFWALVLSTVVIVIVCTAFLYRRLRRQANADVELKNHISNHPTAVNEE